MSKKTTILPADLAALPLEDDTEARQFVIRIGDHRARMEYDRSSDRIFLTGVNIPKAVVEQGLSDPFIERVLTWVEENSLRLVPTHPAIKDYLRRNTAWQRLLLKGVQLR
ncbi:MAG: N-acetyltransferase [Flavobacteriales bacterium]|nr:N-acetyltransferase [Flavobacteriales bacterium]